VFVEMFRLCKSLTGPAFLWEAARELSECLAFGFESPVNCEWLAGGGVGAARVPRGEQQALNRFFKDEAFPFLKSSWVMSAVPLAMQELLALESVYSVFERC
jgi:hypothetical protein